MIKFKLEKKVFGICKRCKINDAYFYPTIICESCHKDWIKLDAFEPGSIERRKAVEKFFAGENIEKILQEVK